MGRIKISIRNTASLSNKTVRFIKWKLYQLSEKFNHLHYAEVHLAREGHRPLQYRVNLKLGIPGHDIVLTNRSEYLLQLLQSTSKAAHRYLNKTKYGAFRRAKNTPIPFNLKNPSQ